MAFDIDIQEDLRNVTRLHNRALRNVNRLLRRKGEVVQQDADAAVIALLEENEQLRERILILEAAQSVDAKVDYHIVSGKTE